MKTVLLLLSVIIAQFMYSSAEGSERAEVSPKSVQEALLKLHWAVTDRETENLEARTARAKVMAQALFDAANEVDLPMKQRHLIGVAASIWWFETRFSLEVHNGGLSRWGSDDGRAKCFGQIHERSVGIKLQEGERLRDFRQRQKDMWESLAGSDYEATKRCAVSTMRHYFSKVGMCRRHVDFWERAFGEYGTGAGTCEKLPTSDRRHLLAVRIAGAI